MGTAIAPAYAILILRAIEEKFWREFCSHNVLNSRFINDGFAVWNPLTELYSFNRYSARLTQLSGLKFTEEERAEEAVILRSSSCWISGDAAKKFETRRYGPQLRTTLNRHC